ncbi:hypothetical protein EDB19DRAFT_1992729 [Suillus lakei]|nr:hypothetical protein EDB19DRAFT_1992729 [Suillus lakei]
MINPEEVRIPMLDDWLCVLYKPASHVPAFLTCIDIASLTAGASTGVGLGNAFGVTQLAKTQDPCTFSHAV